MKLLVATRSAHKLAEIQRMLAYLPDVDVVDLTQAEVPYSPAEERLEPYATFEENARSKALYFHRKSGLPTVADDSGLEVRALGGAPGVRSKRFAPEPPPGTSHDEANNAYLIERLSGVEGDGREARYVCVAALANHGNVRFFRGECYGRIANEPRGEGGFGYDPYFMDPASGGTFAQLSPEEKDQRSHRGIAFRALAQHLSDDDQTKEP